MTGGGSTCLHVVVSYDIAADRRRARVAKQLSNHLVRVQKSVFEGALRAEELRELAGRIATLIDGRRDSVRIYRLCASCQAGTRQVGKSTPGEDALIVV